MGHRRVIAAALWAGSLVASSGVGLVAAGFAGAGLTAALGPDPGPVARVGEATSTDVPAVSQSPGTPATPSLRATVAGGGAPSQAPSRATPAETRSRAHAPNGGRTLGHDGLPRTLSTMSKVTEGGSVFADCSTGWPRLAGSPARGWRAGADRQGSSDTSVAGLDFTRARWTVRISVTCPGSVPEFRVSSDAATPDRGVSPENH